MSSVAVPNASTSPYWGRAWKVSVTKADADGKPFGDPYVISSSEWEPETLRVQFNAQKQVLVAYWYADIVIWNLDPTVMQVFKKGDFVTVAAGYQQTFSADTNVVWDGRILQTIIERENVVDFKMTLHCVVGLLEDESDLISLTVKGGSTELDLVNQIVSKAGLVVDSINSQALAATVVPRGQTVHGRVSQLLNDIASRAGLQYWMSPQGINLQPLVSTSAGGPSYVFGPTVPPDMPVQANLPANYTPTLIGTPEMTQEGVAFRVLLDARLQLCKSVQINNAIIRTIKQYIGQYKTLNLNAEGQLDKDMSFVIVAIQHSGDTRGNSWYSDITAVTDVWYALYRSGAPSAIAN